MCRSEYSTLFDGGERDGQTGEVDGESGCPERDVDDFKKG
jgi:hypothetical protein